MVEIQGERKDIQNFLALPIQKKVRQEMKGFQNEEFVDFVEGGR